MSQFTCPSCSGGFPEPEPGDPPTCPWCGAAMDGSGSVLDSPDLPIVDIDSTGTDEINSLGTGIHPGNSGTTTCPECGREMPLLTHTGPPPLCRACSRKRRIGDPGPVQDGGVE